MKMFISVCAQLFWTCTGLPFRFVISPFSVSVLKPSVERLIGCTNHSWQLENWVGL